MNRKHKSKNQMKEWTCLTARTYKWKHENQNPNEQENEKKRERKMNTEIQMKKIKNENQNQHETNEQPHFGNKQKTKIWNTMQMNMKEMKKKHNPV